MKYLRQYLIPLILLLLFLEIWIGFPTNLEWGADEITLEKSAQLLQETDKRMEGVHLVESRSGSRDWELFAEAAEGSEGKGSWLLKKVRVLFYSKENVEFTVTGLSGVIDTKTKNLIIDGDVVTQSTNGYTFRTAQLNYHSDQRTLQSTDKVKMTGPAEGKSQGLTVEGQKMEANVDQNVMRIIDQVTAEKKLSNGKSVKIKSGTAEFNSKNNSARFREQVSIEVESMKMEGPEAEFQYKGGSDFLQSVLMNGGVRVSDFDKYATSDKVQFDPVDNRFILSGKPRVVQNNDEILGEQIIFIDGGKKVRVEKMRARVEKNE